MGEVITTNLWTWARGWAANEASACLLLAVEWTVAKLIAHRASIDETPTKLTAILTRRNLRIGLTAVRGAPPRTLWPQTKPRLTASSSQLNGQSQNSSPTGFQLCLASMRHPLNSQRSQVCFFVTSEQVIVISGSQFDHGNTGSQAVRALGSVSQTKPRSASSSQSLYNPSYSQVHPHSSDSHMSNR